MSAVIKPHQHLGRTPRMEESNTTYRWFLVTFVTKTIAPASMPGFTYMPTQITHDSIEFTASVPAMSMQEAVETIAIHWDDAVPLYSKETHGPDTFELRSMLLTPMGSLPPPPPPPRKKGAVERFIVWFAGEGKFFKN